MTEKLAATLHAQGHHAVVISRDFSGSVGEIHRFRVAKLFRALSLVRSVRSTVRENRPDVVIHLLTTSLLSFWVDCLLFVAYRRVPRSRRVAYLHSVGFSRLASRSTVLRRLVAALLRGFANVVTLGDLLSSDVRPYIARDCRVEVIHNTLPARSALGDGKYVPSAREAHVKTVLFLSNLLPEKGLEDFIRVASKCVDRSDEFRFVAAGPPTSSQQLEDLKRDAPTNIEYVGEVDELEKSALLQDASVFVFPSHLAHEAQPLVIIEALATGTPVVAFDVGGVSEMLDENSGVVVEPGDVDGLHAAILEVCSSHDAYRRYSDGATSRFQSVFSDDAYSAGWSNLMGNLRGIHPDASQSASANRHESLGRVMLSEIRLNYREPRALLFVVSFRATQILVGKSRARRALVFPVEACYRVFSELVLGIEIRPKTRVGAGLRIYHGAGIVINDHAVLGRGVVLRNGVTIGNAGSDGEAPVIGDQVELGAASIVIGGVTIGDGSVVGAGAVVTHSFPPHSVVAGNPARLLPAHVDAASAAAN